MTNTITPLLRTPFTDIFACINPFQSHRQCAKHELRIMDCMEAYGVPKGMEKCALLIEDFHECVMKSKQMARIEIMAVERQRQFEAGERKTLYADDIAPNSY